MAQTPSGKPDYLVEAALAHTSAAKVWEALAERERQATAASQALADRDAAANRVPAEGVRAKAKVALVPLAKLAQAAALRLVPPVPKRATPPLAAGAVPQGPLAPGAVRKSSGAPQAEPKAPVQAPGVAAPKKEGRKSSHVRARAPSQYEYETPVYYTSAAEAPEELADAEKKA